MALKHTISSLEQMLENVKQSLADTESLLADGNDEIDALHANIRDNSAVEATTDAQQSIYGTLSMNLQSQIVGEFDRVFF